MENQILKKLEEHDQIFARHDQIFVSINQKLAKHDQMFVELKAEVHKNGILHEDNSSTLKQVLEIVLHMNRRLVPKEDIDPRFENHEHRIAALENDVRKRGV
jgi:hypothetical protein